MDYKSEELVWVFKGAAAEVRSRGLAVDYAATFAVPYYGHESQGRPNVLGALCLAVASGDPQRAFTKVANGCWVSSILKAEQSVLNARTLSFAGPGLTGVLEHYALLRALEVLTRGYFRRGFNMTPFTMPRVLVEAHRDSTEEEVIKFFMDASLGKLPVAA